MTKISDARPLFKDGQLAGKNEVGYDECGR